MTLPLSALQVAGLWSPEPAPEPAGAASTMSTSSGFPSVDTIFVVLLLVMV